VLIIDGIKYRLWTPKDEEKEFHPMVRNCSKEVFGENSIYFDIKHKLTSKSGIAAIPDAYVITLSKPYEWYIVENELSAHPVYSHIVPQISKFVDSIEELETQRDVRDILNNEIEQDVVLKACIEKKTGKDPYRFLSELLSLPPKIALIIDEITPEVDKASKSLKKLANTQIVEFKTFVREDAPNVHAHLFEPLFKPEVKKIEAPEVKPKEPPTISREELSTLKDGVVVICPSKPDGVNFLLQHKAWGFVRIRKRPQYFALYISYPESRVSYFGEVKEVLEPKDPESPMSEEEARNYKEFKEGKKIIFLKPDSLKKLDRGIPKGTLKGRLQGLKYTTLSKLTTARTLDDI